MPVIAIAIFRPKPGNTDELLGCLRDHMPLMRRLNFVTKREAIVMRAAGGEILEVFEWISPEAIDAAHEDPEVLALWKRYEACCEYITLSDLAEATKLFPGFEPIEL